MKKALFSIAAAALALALVGPAQAQEKASDKGTPPKRFTGVIEKIDGKTITLKKGDETLTVTCSDKCKVVTAEKKEGATLDDLKQGDKVLAFYTQQDDQNVCHRIQPPLAGKSAGKGKKQEP